MPHQATPKPPGPKHGAVTRTPSNGSESEGFSDLSHAQVELEKVRAQIQAAREQREAQRLDRLEQEVEDYARKYRTTLEELSTLRGSHERALSQARQAAREEHEAELRRLRDQLETLKDERQEIRMRLQEERLKRELSPMGEQTVSKELIGVVKEHGGDFLGQVMTLLAQRDAAQRKQQAAQQAASKGQQAAQKPAGLPGPLSPNAPEGFDPAQGDGFAGGIPDGAFVSTDTPLEGAGKPSAPAQPAAPQQQAQQQQAQQAPGMPQRPPTPQEVFLSAVLQNAIEEMENEVSDPQAFRAGIQHVLGELERRVGWTPDAETFVLLTELLIPEAIRRGAAAGRVAQIMAAFAVDLPKMALKVITGTPPAALKAHVIDPYGVDFQGHDEFALAVLGAIQNQLKR